MHLVIFHKLLDFWHLTNEFGHLLQVHIIRIMTAPLFGILDYFLGLSCNLVEYVGEMSISESYPEVILVI